MSLREKCPFRVGLCSLFFYAVFASERARATSESKVVNLAILPKERISRSFHSELASSTITTFPHLTNHSLWREKNPCCSRFPHVRTPPPLRENAFLIDAFLFIHGRVSFAISFRDPFSHLTIVRERVPSTETCQNPAARAPEREREVAAVEAAVLFPRPCSCSRRAWSSTRMTRRRTSAS